MPPSPAQAQVAPQSLGTKPPPSYDFEKRKRWADLLLTEFVDNVPFILSSTCKIWFCGVAVVEILGWRDTDLVDLDFIDLIEITDQDRFRFAFEQGIENASGFDISVRLRGCDNSLVSYPISQSKAIVFNIKCLPHIIPPSSKSEVEIRCLIAMVSPYPSRNTAMLNTMVDLKIQNDHLQRRLREHRERGPLESPNSTYFPSSQAGPMYATSSLHTTKNPLMSGSASFRTGNFSSSYQSSMVQIPLEGLKGGFSQASDIVIGSAYLCGPAGAEERGDESSKKKKLKRSQNAEQYVCNQCGRTDSPEWRKGPQGPKTLCNACGLRWAKQMRRVDDLAVPAASSSGDI
ncbi:hypothetical protein CPB84DRAFT_1763187 [Gymnopilus junonius]|uniref:GATA-type domain-containing protein n=1 Tax=Gymnopilus junonius TaxID=109634 RepID=A0A9P5P028_GYMJU|nr:hypothetical protein CPB84DRAFT_1763187 [Gymnopilus junonius]